MLFMRRVFYSSIGVLLLLFGFLLYIESFQDITGRIVSSGADEGNIRFAGIYFIFAGMFSLFLSMKRKKGQAAMEFLMTYGWAILAAIVAIGMLAYIGIFNFDGLAGNNGMIDPPFYLSAENVELSGVNIELANGASEPYDISKVEVEGCGEFGASISIGAGTSTTLNLPCNLTEGNFKGYIKVFYKKKGSNLELISNGIITGQATGNVNLVPNWLMIGDTGWDKDSPEKTLVLDYNNIEVYSHDSRETDTKNCYNWAGTSLIPADSNKAYKYSIWIKSTDTLMDNFFGFNIYNSATNKIAGDWSNPYFKSDEGDSNTWQKFEGFLGPSSYGGATGCDSDSTNGDDWCMASNTAYMIMRFGGCYSDGDSTGHTYFIYPRIEEVSWPP